MKRDWCRGICALLCSALLCGSSFAADISNPINLVFAADGVDALIDVIDVKKSQVVYRINAPHRADAMVVTPYAPLLFFSNIEKKTVVAYDLSKKEVDRSLALSIVPRHLVMDPSGKYLGATDSEGGGIAIISAYSREVIYEDASFPATSNVLFDPNEIDLYFVNNATGALGRLDLNTHETTEIVLVEGGAANLSSPSRSLDGRYIYVADLDAGSVYSINAFSGVIFKTFDVGEMPARPFTSPEGVFLYLIDQVSGSFASIEQGRFVEHSREEFGAEIELVTVGRFDRLNLLVSRTHREYFIYDNLSKSLRHRGRFTSNPSDAQGGIDGVHAYIAFEEEPQIAVVNLESHKTNYIPATATGVGAFVVGATNNVCH